VRGRGPGERLRGSPLLALNTRAAFETVIYVEEDAVARDGLARRVNRHPRGKTAQILGGDCNAVIEDVIAKMPKRYLSLVFVDPVGVVDLDPLAIERLAVSRNVDLIILFAQQMSVNRNKWQWRVSEEETPLDRLLGRQWRTSLTPEVQQFMGVLRGSTTSMFAHTTVLGKAKAWITNRREVPLR
jgi:three-Cys-motif partner protein